MQPLAGSSVCNTAEVTTDARGGEDGERDLRQMTCTAGYSAFLEMTCSWMHTAAVMGKRILRCGKHALCRLTFRRDVSGSSSGTSTEISDDETDHDGEVQSLSLSERKGKATKSLLLM